MATNSDPETVASMREYFAGLDACEDEAAVRNWNRVFFRDLGGFRRTRADGSVQRGVPLHPVRQPDE